MEEALRQLLTSDVPLTALVDGRVYWKDIPQGQTSDLVVLHRISGAPSYHMQGPADLEVARVQINSRAETVTRAWAIRRAVKARLSGFKGVHGGIYFDGIFLEDEGDLPTEDPPGPNIYRGTRSDFTVWSRPA